MWETLALKVALIAAAAHAVTGLLRRHSAAERHLLWLCAFTAVLLLPLLERSAPAVVVLPAAPAVTLAPLALPASDIPAPVDWTPRLWFAGATLVLLYRLAGFLLLARLHRHLRPFTAQPHWIAGARTARVCTSPQVASPLTYGLLRPVIVLPESAAHWSPARLRVVLLHEAAHIARFDFATQLLAHLACAIHWYNPLLWLGASTMRKEQEKACDDIVLNHAVSGADYAQHLLELAATTSPVFSIPMAHHSNLESRIRAALDPDLLRRRPTVRARLLGVAATAILALALVVTKTQAQGAGQLTGSVLDASGAAIPRTEVLLLFSGGRREITRSAEDGKYAFSSLPPGIFTIEARQPGFALFQLKDVRLEPNEQRHLDLKLQLGQIRETIDVVGKKPPASASTLTPAPLNAPKRIRVGGAVQASKLLKMTRPTYPEQLQQSGIEGTVLLEGLISVEGNLLSLRNLNTQVHPDLIQSATAAVQQWRYQPTLLNGQPVEIITTITVNYKLAP